MEELRQDGCHSDKGPPKTHLEKLGIPERRLPRKVKRDHASQWFWAAIVGGAIQMAVMSGEHVGKPAVLMARLPYMHR